MSSESRRKAKTLSIISKFIKTWTVKILQRKFKISCLFIYILHPAILGKIMTNAKILMSIRLNFIKVFHFDSCFIRRGSFAGGKKLRATTNRGCIKITTEISIPDLRTWAVRKVSRRGKVVFVGDIRRERAKRSEIDKAHVLHGGWESLAGSKYGGTQLSPPNCRDNATDGFDRNPSLSFPPVGLPTWTPILSFSSSLPLPPSFSHSARRSPLSSAAHAVFLASFLANFLPVDSIRRHATPYVRFHLADKRAAQERRDFIPIIILIRSIEHVWQSTRVFFLIKLG